MKKLVNIIEKKLYVTMTLIATCGILTACSLDFSEWMMTEEERGHGEPYTEETEYGNITYEFNDSVISITKNIEEYIVKVENDSILYFMDSTPEEWMPYVGCKLFAERSRKHYKGLCHQVIDVKNVGGMYRVVTKPTSSDNVFKSLDYNIDVDLESPLLADLDDATLEAMGYERRDSIIIDWNFVDAAEMGVSQSSLRKQRYETAMHNLAKKSGINTRSRAYEEDKSFEIYDIDVNTEEITVKDVKEGLVGTCTTLNQIGLFLVNLYYSKLKDPPSGLKAGDVLIDVISRGSAAVQGILSHMQDKEVTKKLFNDQYVKFKQKGTMFTHVHAERATGVSEEDYTISHEELTFDMESGIKDPDMKKALASGDRYAYTKALCKLLLNKAPEQLTSEERKGLNQLMEEMGDEWRSKQKETAEFSSMGEVLVDIPIPKLQMEFAVTRSLSSSEYSSWGLYSASGKVVTPTVKRGYKYQGLKERLVVEYDGPGGGKASYTEHSCENQTRIYEVLNPGSKKITKMIGNGGWNLKWNPTMSLMLFFNLKALGLGVCSDMQSHVESECYVRTSIGEEKYMPYVVGETNGASYTAETVTRPMMSLFSYDIFPHIEQAAQSLLNKIKPDETVRWHLTETDYPTSIYDKTKSTKAKLYPVVSSVGNDFYVKTNGNQVVGDFVADFMFKTDDLSLHKTVLSAKNIYPALRLYRAKSSTLDLSGVYVDMTPCVRNEEKITEQESYRRRGIDEFKGKTISYVAKDFVISAKEESAYIVPVWVVERNNGLLDTLTYSGSMAKKVAIYSHPYIEEYECLQLYSKKVNDPNYEPVRNLNSGQSSIDNPQGVENLYEYDVAYVFTSHNFSTVRKLGFYVTLICDGKKILDNESFTVFDKDGSSGTKNKDFSKGNHSVELRFYSNIVPKSSDFHMDIQPFYTYRNYLDMGMGSGYNTITDYGKKSTIYLVREDNFISDKYNTIHFGRDKDEYGEASTIISLR